MTGMHRRTVGNLARHRPQAACSATGSGPGGPTGRKNISGAEWALSSDPTMMPGWPQLAASH